VPSNSMRDGVLMYQCANAALCPGGTVRGMTGNHTVSAGWYGMTPAEIAAKNKYQDQNYGTKFFPTTPDIQHEVFDNSFTGRATQDYLNVLLIRSTAPDDKNVGGEGSIRRQRERRIDDIMEKR